ncbi:MAG: PaaI family thioesterase [Oscillospiraceae bacterium]
MPTEILTQEQYSEKITALLHDDYWQQMPMLCAQLKPFPESWDAETMRLRTSFNTADWMGNPINWLHGGIITTIFDNAMGTLAAIHACSSFTPTVSIQVNFLRPVPTEGKVFVDAHITKLGKTLIYLNAELFREGQAHKLSATASAVYAVHNEARFA